MTSNQEFYDKLYYNLNTTGPTLSPFDSYMLMRGLKTLKLRMEASTANAQEVVAFLEKSPAVKEVLYPGKGGMISFKVADQDKIPTIINSLKVFTFAESLGGVESLITYPTTQTHADIPSDVRASYGSRHHHSAHPGRGRHRLPDRRPGQAQGHDQRDRQRSARHR